MECKDVLAELRKQKGLTQEEMARRFFVTRQAVSRWETGETTPGIDTLKLISKEFSVSINTLLGSPQRLFCQCCGMPMQDSDISREPAGAFNEDYCKWCYSQGKMVYGSMEELLDFLAPHLASMHGMDAGEVRKPLEEQLKGLKNWREE
ncbi:MAG: zinc ribbon domain-containing protein [Christensenellales bacterium]